MKLYYTPGACSLSPHIIACEAGLNVTPVKVDMKTRMTENGENFKLISEKGYVPHLILDDGQSLTEGVAIVQYMADLKPEAKLLPPSGTFERVRAQEWLNYISTELHKSHSPLFTQGIGSVATEIYTEKLKKAYSFIEEKLQKNSYLMGEQFTVVDAYLFTVMGWAGYINFDLSPWPRLVDYKARVAARPGVQAAMKAEGLK